MPVYRNYEVAVNNEGNFICPALEIEPKETYKSACSAIDAELRKEKEVSVRVRVLKVEENGYFRSSTPQLFCGITGAEKQGRYGARNSVWVTWDSGKKKERGVENYSEIYRDTPENRAALEEYIQQVSAARKAEQAARDFKGTIPTMATETAA